MYLILVILGATVPLSSQSNGFPHFQNNQRPDGGTNRPAPSFQEQPSFSQQQPQAERFNFFDSEILMRLDTKNENVFLSPASIKATLAMILEGAKDESARQIAVKLRVSGAIEARQRISDFIHGLKQSGRTTLEAGHGIFVSDHYQNDLTFSDYKKIIRDYYAAHADIVDFSNPIQASDRINEWVSQTTHHFITDVLTPDNVNPNTGLILASALYFKGDWKHEFNPALTQPRNFHVKKKGCIKVNMMQITETFNYDLNEDMDAHVVELPYSDDKYAMLLIVPQTKEADMNIASDINHTSLNKILEQMYSTEVILHMPKFDIDYSTDLKYALSSMQITDIFGRNADLTGISSSRPLSIDALVHRARIEVSEKGTIAASVTTATVVPLIGSSSPVVIADHPFAFLIYDKAKKNVIFEGILNEPKEAYGGVKCENIAPTFGQQPIKQSQGQSNKGRTNPLRPVQDTQQLDQQQLRTSNPLPRQPQTKNPSYTYTSQHQDVYSHDPYHN